MDGRRIEDDGQPRTFVWDATTRRVVASIAAEVFTQAEERMSKYFGVAPQEHAEHHSGLDELIPWIRAQKKKTEAQAEFWQGMMRENVRRAVAFLFWALVIAMGMGMLPAFKWLLTSFRF